MRLTGNVARRGKVRNACNSLVGNSEGKIHSENLGVDGWIILDRVLRK